MAVLCLITHQKRFTAVVLCRALSDRLGELKGKGMSPNVLLLGNNALNFNQVKTPLLTDTL